MNRILSFFRRPSLADTTADTTADTAPAEPPPPMENNTGRSEEAKGADFIDVRRLMQELSVEELCETAEEYFSSLTDWTHLQSKPFGFVQEVPHVLIRFSTLLQGLALGPNMTVLDFGSGPGWATHYLTQLGCRIIALDVSETAHKISQARFAQQPVFGDHPAPRFLTFDGRRIDLPDASVDRIFCHDAFHHVPNPGEVLEEMSRVLASGGIAGFAEPGPSHSRALVSQTEMRNYKVVENDIRIEEIWAQAQKAGFTDIRLAVLYTPLYQMPLPEFQDFLANGSAVEKYAQTVCAYMQEHRVFFLYKGPFIRDSRLNEGLKAAIEMTLTPGGVVSAGQTLTIQAKITNRGEARWRTREGEIGSVHFGAHLYDTDGRQTVADYARYPLRPDGGETPVEPGESVTLSVTAPAPPAGNYQIGFDMVSHGVCWFAWNGGEEKQFRIESVA